MGLLERSYQPRQQVSVALAASRDEMTASSRGISGRKWDLGLTWKFAPNTAFDLAGGWLFAGKALDTFETLNGVATRRKAQDAWTVASRVRFSF